GRQITPIRSTTRGPANSFTSRKVVGVAKGITPQRQTEKPEHRKTYQNPGQKQGRRQLRHTRLAKRTPIAGGRQPSLRDGFLRRLLRWWRFADHRL
ncbi:uncharacterized protein METZ01_LOCUS157515, partial [marine metagenome]